VIIVDANIVIYAHYTASPNFQRCKAWLESALNGSEQIGFPWQTILAFVRIITNTRVFERAMSNAEASEAVDAWLACPTALIVEPGQQFWTILKEQMAAAQVTGVLVSDAALASLAIERGARLCTLDRDFARFRGLKVIEPAAA